MKIQTIQGGWDSTCTTSNSLTENAVKKPFIRDIIEYADARTLSTMIVSGARTPWDLRTKDTSAIKTKIGQIPDKKAIGDQAMRYKVQGRIEKKSSVIAQVGTTSADGYFMLRMKDSLLYPGQMVKFYRDHFYARVSGTPQKSAGGFIYTFHNPNELFVSATHLHPTGESFAFGAYTSYGEASVRGYSRSFYPSEFIQHMTTQRKELSLTGDALTDVTWYVADGMKGWKYTKEVQSRIQFMMENERAKWDGTSSMKDANGNLLTRSLEIDPDTGFEIIRGDGVLPLIEGGNEHFGSGADGKATIDDVADMMRNLEKRSNKTDNNYWYMVVGTDGYAHYQDLFRDFWVNNLGGNVVHNNGGNSGVGGDDINVGQNFDTFNLYGNKVILCKNVAWDNDDIWYEKGSNGESLRGNMAVFLDPGDVSSPNIEILTKGAYGINRSMVEFYLNGATGHEGKPVHSVDAISYNQLKQDMIVIYNTTSCGTLHMSPN